MKSVLAGVIVAMALTAPAWAALKPGTVAPDFSVKAALGGKDFDFNLKTALKKGPVVLYFFPAVHTGGCNIEAHNFAEAADSFSA